MLEKCLQLYRPIRARHISMLIIFELTWSHKPHLQSSNQLKGCILAYSVVTTSVWSLVLSIVVLYITFTAVMHAVLRLEWKQLALLIKSSIETGFVELKEYIQYLHGNGFQKTFKRFVHMVLWFLQCEHSICWYQTVVRSKIICQGMPVFKDTTEDKETGNSRIPNNNKILCSRPELLITGVF